MPSLSRRSRFLRRSCVVATVAVAISSAATRAQSFTVIGLPDTQFYSESFPQIFAAQTQWIVDNVQALDIRFVSHYGDLVQHGDRLNEWANADAAMQTLDQAGVPYGVTAGNHDVLPSGLSGQTYIPQNYFSFFGPHRYANRPWYRCASPSGMSSYQVFDADGLQFLALFVEVDAPARELEWAQGVLDANRDKPVMFTTHRYLQDAEDYTAGVPIVPSGRYPEIWYTIEGVYTPGGLQSEDYWRRFIRRNPNIFLVNCGHFHEEFRQSSTNVKGLTVHEVLADYQDDPNGGNGWLRIMEFDLGNNRIDVESYSPTLNQFRSADESRFSLPVNFRDYRELRPTVVLQEGVNGYTGTRDTWIDEASGGSSFGNSGILRVDDDTRNGFFSDDRGQALVRFEGLVGAPGQGAIPPGAQVVEAWLTIDVLEDIDSPFNADFLVHRVIRDWNESSTWNSLGNGLQVGQDIEPAFAEFDGDNNPNADSMRRIDVTAAVQSWVNGSPNFGFAILPEIIGGNDDGIEIASSENGNVILRPRLEVVYDSDCGFTGYGLNGGAAQTLTLFGLGLPRVGETLEFRAVGAPNVQSFLTAVSTAPAQQSFFGATFHIDLGLVLDVFSHSGPLVLPIPADPSLTDLELFAQSFAFDASQPSGFVHSNGVQGKICR